MDGPLRRLAFHGAMPRTTTPPDVAPAASAHLLLLPGVGEHAPRVVPVVADVTHIGRGRDRTVRIDDHTVSRRHATLVRTPEGLRIVDERSLNGVLVNGRRVLELPLRDGDVVHLGRVALVVAAAGVGAAGATTERGGAR